MLAHFLAQEGTKSISREGACHDTQYDTMHNVMYTMLNIKEVFIVVGFNSNQLSGSLAGYPIEDGDNISMTTIPDHMTQT